MHKLLNHIVETGKICCVTFTKKDGSIGRVHGRTGVTRYIKYAGQHKRTSDPKQYIMFYDFQKGYRNVNRDTITTVNGINLKIKTK